MNTAAITKLAQEAVELGEQLTEADPRAIEAFFDHARLSLPALARAWIAVQPYIQHRHDCPKVWFDPDIAVKYNQKCRCGLDSALGAMETP